MFVLVRARALARSHVCVLRITTRDNSTPHLMLILMILCAAFAFVLHTVCMCVRAHARVCACIYVCERARVCVCMCARARACVFFCQSVDSNIKIHQSKKPIVLLTPQVQRSKFKALALLTASNFA